MKLLKNENKNKKKGNKNGLKIIFAGSFSTNEWCPKKRVFRFRINQ